MMHVKDFSAAVFPRSGLQADGPDWDAGVETSVWRPEMGDHPLLPRPKEGTPFDASELLRKQLATELPSMAKQEFADDADINTIMSRYQDTGVLPEGRRQPLEAGDYISEYSFQESLNAVIASRELFADLPSRVRERFGNDPAKLFAFLEDPRNREEGIKLGLIKEPDPEPAPMKVEVTNASPPKPDGP